MKQLIGSDIGSYEFNKDLNQITLFDIPNNLNQSNILLITNVTTKTILYNFADNSNFISINNNIITLSYNCASMNENNILQIWIDIPVTQNINVTNNFTQEETLLAIKELSETFRNQIQQLINIFPSVNKYNYLITSFNGIAQPMSIAGNMAYAGYSFYSGTGTELTYRSRILETWQMSDMASNYLYEHLIINN